MTESGGNQRVITFNLVSRGHGAHARPEDGSPIRRTVRQAPEVVVKVSHRDSNDLKAVRKYDQLLLSYLNETLIRDR